MSLTSFDERRQIEAMDRSRLSRFQLERFNRLLADVIDKNEFYRHKLAQCPSRLDSLVQLSQLPLTLKDELLPAEGEGPFARNLTYEVDRYVRLHQTSGSRGRPLVVLNSAEDWGWWIECWQFVLDAAEITSHDRALLAFSFGPFVGFWSAFDALVAARRAGHSGRRHEQPGADRHDPTGERDGAYFARRPTRCGWSRSPWNMRLILRATPIEKIVVAGEPGGSVPSVRARIEEAWGRASDRP